ncbi:CRIB domain-containing protein RIC4-like [Andrographis paniculata]|uniref:CRIB domain-containing protein RIC4-like n=1 Tax=Andrographis paniculata TaxID=175694 RepID=UPI0021E938C3|nr:CRIB domain-containing protein RIC4-like [Andrographis paniculata]
MNVKESRVERFLLLPFSLGCDSNSSVAIAGDSPTKHSKTGLKGGEDQNLFMKKKKKNGFWKVTFSQGFSRFINTFKSLSQIFVYKKELEEEDDEEDKEMEMKIGFPTDVKHVTHIGLDGSTNHHHHHLLPQYSQTLNPTTAAPETVSFHSLSLQLFQSAMAAQAQAQAHNSLHTPTAAGPSN